MYYRMILTRPSCLGRPHPAYSRPPGPNRPTRPGRPGRPDPADLTRPDPAGLTRPARPGQPPARPGRPDPAGPAGSPGRPSFSSVAQKIEINKKKPSYLLSAAVFLHPCLKMFCQPQYYFSNFARLFTHSLDCTLKRNSLSMVTESVISQSLLRKNAYWTTTFLGSHAKFASLSRCRSSL